jgi:hypothetical protein
MYSHKPLGIVGRFVLNPTFRSLVPEKWDRISDSKTGSPVSGICGRNLYPWYAWRCLLRVVLLRLRSWCFLLGVALFGEGAPACEFAHVRFWLTHPWVAVGVKAVLLRMALVVLLRAEVAAFALAVPFQ